MKKKHLKLIVEKQKETNKQMWSMLQLLYLTNQRKADNSVDGSWTELDREARLHEEIQRLLPQEETAETVIEKKFLST